MLAAVDIGGTKIRILLATRAIKVLAESIMATPKDRNAALTKITENLRTLADNNKIKAIGVTCPGPINKKTGTILNPRNLTWGNIKICDYLQSKFDCPCILEHDATAGGIAEVELGSVQGKTTVLFITISTGIGTSIIVDGQPLPSPYNSEGGTHIIQAQPFPGQQFQNLTAGRAIEHQYKKTPQFISSNKSWDQIAKNLSIGIYNLAVTVQPDVVVLAGGVAVHFNKFIKPLRKYLAKQDALYPLPPIVKAKFVKTAPAIGALLLAEQKIRKLPKKLNYSL